MVTCPNCNRRFPSKAELHDHLVDDHGAIPLGADYEDDPYGAQCVVCGCTEDRPCPGGCYWVEDPARPMENVCSRCVGLPTLAELGESGWEN